MTLDEKAADAAANAKCSRCDTVIMNQLSRTGLTLVTLRISALQVTQGSQLCGHCGIHLREFLNPTLEYNAEFQACKSELIRRWA